MHQNRRPRPLGIGRATRLVATREITAKLRSRAFQVSTVILLVAVLVSVVVGSIVGTSRSDTQTTIAAVGRAQGIASLIPGFRVVDAASLADAEALLRDGTVDAVLAPTDDAGAANGILVIGLHSAPTAIVTLMSQPPSVQVLDPEVTNPFLAYLISLGFGLTFFMSAITFGTTIAQSVVEEKQTRIVEILLSAVPVRALLAGKVLGNSVLAFAQIVVIGGLTAIGLALTGQRSLLLSLGPSIVWFVVFFVFGFVLLASLYAAAASLVSRQEDVGSVTSPVALLVIAPYILTIIFNGNPGVLAVLSYVPFSAPVAMPVRLFLGDAEGWEPLVSLAVLLACAVAVVALGSRVYANSLLHTGSRMSLRRALWGRLEA